MSTAENDQRDETSMYGNRTVLAYLLLGGNLGDVEFAFKESKRLLQERFIYIRRESSLYKSKAWGFDSNNDFLNQVLEVETEHSAHILLEKALQVEQELGRTRNNIKGYSSRPIDIDILFYANDIVEDENLTIPHPRIQERKFTLEPLNELVPEYIHPMLQTPISQLLKRTTDKSEVWKV